MSIKKIRVGTLFSGIGSFEWALRRMNIDHEIIFACDNGDVDLVDANTDELLVKSKECKTVLKMKEFEDTCYSNIKKTNYGLYGIIPVVWKSVQLIPSMKLRAWKKPLL